MRNKIIFLNCNEKKYFDGINPINIGIGMRLSL